MTRITPFTAVPNRGMSQETLITTTNTFFSEVGGFVGQANQLIGDINTAATNAIFTAPDWVAQAYESHKVVIYTDHNVYMSTEATISTDVPSVSAKWKNLIPTFTPTPSLDSIVVLTSGTSWTCPAGVTKAKIKIVGGGGGGGKDANDQSAGGGGGGGGGVEALIDLTPTNTYTYTIGAGGIAAATAGTTGGNGGNSTFVLPIGTITATGGMGGEGTYSGGSYGLGGSGMCSGTITNYTAFTGGNASYEGTYGSFMIAGGYSILGQSGGYGSRSDSAAQAGFSGKIVMELYK